jgi:hypothetical protein
MGTRWMWRPSNRKLKTNFGGSSCCFKFCQKIFFFNFHMFSTNSYNTTFQDPTLIVSASAQKLGLCAPRGCSLLGVSFERGEEGSTFLWKFWGPPSLVSNKYRGIFLAGYSDRGVNLTTHLQLVPRSRKRASIHPLPHTPLWHSA